MSSQGTRENRQEKFERPLGAGPTRQVNAEELLAELKRLLESSRHPPFAPPPSASTVFASASTAAEPRQSTEIEKAHDSTDDLSADGSLKRRSADLRDTYGQHEHLTREATHLRSRRWRLVASGLALGFAVVVGAGLALKSSAPASKGPLSVVPVQERSVVPMQGQSNIQPPGGESVVSSGEVGGPLMKDGPPPEHMEVGSTEAGTNAKELTAKTSVAIDAQRPAEGPSAVAVATTVDTPAIASAAAGSALTVSQTARLEPVRSVLVRPDGTPIATISANSTSPSETPNPHTEAATTAGVRVDSANPSATKIDLPATPTASKKSGRKIVAKSVKATTGAMAEAPKQPLPPVQPEKAVKLPTAQAVTDQVAAAPTAPTTPTTFAAQSVSRLTQAFVYLSHLPVALIQHPTDTNTEAK